MTVAFPPPLITAFWLSGEAGGGRLRFLPGHLATPPAVIYCGCTFFVRHFGGMLFMRIYCGAILFGSHSFWRHFFLTAFLSGSRYLWWPSALAEGQYIWQVNSRKLLRSGMLAPLQ